MSIVWDWSDRMLEGMEGVVPETCSLSGEKIEVPFMLWVGPEIIAINATSMHRSGAGFDLDISILSYIGRKLGEGVSVGKVQRMFVNRLKGGE